MPDGRSARATVTDASVALKWQLEDEHDSEQALTLRDDFLIQGRITLYAPELYLYEIINGIASAVRRQRLHEHAGREALLNLLSVSVALRTAPVDRTYHIALQYGLSAYDSSYVALAEALQAEFWTADRELYEAVNPELPWVRWIGDYPTG